MFMKNAEGGIIIKGDSLQNPMVQLKRKKHGNRLNHLIEE